MKCPHCGREVANDSIFCEYCGKQLRKQINMTKLWLALAIVWGVLVQGICVLLIFKLNTKEERLEVIISRGAPVNGYEENMENPIDSEDVISIATNTPAKTIEQIEQDADNLLRDIKAYNEIITALKATIQEYAKKVQESIVKLDKRGLSASLEILNNANKTKSLVDSDMNTLKQNVTNAKQKQQALSQTKVTEKIQQANSIIKEYEEAQQDAQNSITQIDNNIKKIQTYIDNLKKEAKQPPKEITYNQPQMPKNTNAKEIKKYTKTLRYQKQFMLHEVLGMDSVKCYAIKWTSSDSTIVGIQRWEKKKTVSIEGKSAGQARVTGQDETYCYAIDVTVK